MNPTEDTLTKIGTPQEQQEASAATQLVTIKSHEAHILTTDVRCRLECLVHDLRSFSKDSAASTRVERANIHPFCLGPPYMPLEMGNMLLDLTLSNDLSVKEYLGSLVEGKGYHICTSHTLAPAIAEVFGLQDDFNNGSFFKKYYKQFCCAARKCGDEVALPTENTPESEQNTERKKDSGSSKMADKKGKKSKGK
jgi:hypothetical protein